MLLIHNSLNRNIFGTFSSVLLMVKAAIVHIHLIVDFKKSQLNTRTVQMIW